MSSPRADLVDLTASHRLAGWVRIVIWCRLNANPHGHARAYAGQLRTDLGFTSSREVSRAIKTARTSGLIDPCSSARCLVLPDRAHAPCDAHHRDTP